MRKSGAALLFGTAVEKVECGQKQCACFFVQTLRQIIVKCTFRLRFGIAQSLCRLGCVEKLTATVFRVRFTAQIAFSFQVCRSARDGRLIGVKSGGKFGLRDTRVVPHRVNTVDFRSANAVPAHGEQNKMLRLTGNFGYFSRRIFHVSFVPSFC